MVPIDPEWTGLIEELADAGRTLVRAGLVLASGGNLSARVPGGAVAAVTFVYAQWLHISNAATASTTFLLIVLVAATSRLWVPAVTAVAAMFAFNYFFLPPVGGLTTRAAPLNREAV